MFALGLGLYVAQSLCALCGLELVSGRAAGVSQGGHGRLTGWVLGGPLDDLIFHGDSTKFNGIYYKVIWKMNNDGYSIV